MRAAMSEGSRESRAPAPGKGAGGYFGINRTAAALLVVLATLGMAEEVWRQFLPLYLNVTLDDIGKTIGYVGVFACLTNLLEGIGYIVGGRVAHRLGARSALAVSALPMLGGFAIMLVSREPWALVAGALMVTNWEPLSVPATFDVMGAEVPKNRRTVAFAVQSIQKRVPKILGPILGTLVFAAVGYGANVGIALGLIAVSLAVQYTLIPRAVPRAAISRASAREILRGMSPELKTLLTAEILIRWGEWFIRDFASLYVVYSLGVSKGHWGWFPALSSAVALATYIPFGKLIDRSPSPKPFIGLTFFLFASFPLLLVLLPKTGMPVYVAVVCVFIVNGLRELGEPARKAFITAAFPPEHRAQGVGLYWGTRSMAFCAAPIVAWMCWKHIGPDATFLIAGALGMLGTALYIARTKMQSAATNGSRRPAGRQSPAGP